MVEEISRPVERQHRKPPGRSQKTLNLKWNDETWFEKAITSGSGALIERQGVRRLAAHTTAKVSVGRLVDPLHFPNPCKREAGNSCDEVPQRPAVLDQAKMRINLSPTFSCI
jgi:hypothetical protein